MDLKLETGLQLLESLRLAYEKKGSEFDG